MCCGFVVLLLFCLNNENKIVIYTFFFFSDDWQSDTTEAEIKVPSVENPELANVLHLNPGICRNIATHASPTAKNSFFVLNFTFPGHLPSLKIKIKSSSYFFYCIR